MKGSRSRSKYSRHLRGRSCAGFSPLRKPPALTKILGLVFILASTLSGAFEGSDLFRAAFAGVDGVFPPSLNNPARLPDQAIWLSVGRGQPLGRSWAAYSTVSMGGRAGNWRSAAGVWRSGDELYRETSLSATLARQIRSRFIAGLSLAYHDVTVNDYDPIEGELLIGAALNAPLSERIDATVWYSGQTLGRKRAYGSLTRQLYQLAVISRINEGTTLTLAVEKTPPFALRQLAEISLVTRREVTLLFGYRTAPGLPYAGAQVPIRRLLISVRLNVHPIFGLSTAFGFSFK